MPFQIPPKTCPVCIRGNKFKFIKDHQSEEGNFSLYQCLSCDVQFWIPFKNPGIKWYERNEENIARKKLRDKGEINLIVRNSWNTAQFFSHLPYENPSGKKLLDLGCGTGGFLLEAQKLGYEVYGVDFDKEEVEIAKSLGLKNIYVAEIFDFLKEADNKSKFNVVTGFEIIEHLDTPKEFLKLVFESLKPKGYLALSTPNRERFWGNIKENWDLPYHHLMRFNLFSLKRLLAKSGFKTIKAKEQIPIDYFIRKARIGLGLQLKKFIQSSKKTNRLALKEINITKLGYTKDKLMKVFTFLPALIAFNIFSFKGTGLYILGQKYE